MAMVATAAMEVTAAAAGMAVMGAAMAATVADMVDTAAAMAVMVAAMEVDSDLEDSVDSVAVMEATDVETQVLEGPKFELN